MSEASDTDYYFLRNNGLDVKTALRILAIAYKTEERPEKVKKEEEKFYGILNRCSGVSK